MAPGAVRAPFGAAPWNAPLPPLVLCPAQRQSAVYARGSVLLPDLVAAARAPFRRDRLFRRASHRDRNRGRDGLLLPRLRGHPLVRARAARTPARAPPAVPLPAGAPPRPPPQ